MSMRTEPTYATEMDPRRTIRPNSAHQKWTWMPNFNRSPWIRLARHVRLLSAISSINMIVSDEIGGRPCLACDFRRQYNLKPCRCQPISVSGFTIFSASRQLANQFASQTKTCRSRGLNSGRATCRSNKINCCRKNMFSAINSALLRLRSATVLNTWFVLAGFVQSLNRNSILPQQL